MNDLLKAREIINKVDTEMAKLFEERMEAAKMVAAYKKEHGLPVDDLSREEEIIKKNTEKIERQEYKSYYTSFLRNNIDLSKALQHRLLDGMRVAYSGVKGAFAEISAKKIFPAANAVSFPDFKAAFEAVQNGECDCALLPIENSFNGDVGKVMDLAFFGNLYINGIYDIEINQNLLALKGATIDGIKKVLSHPQALGQCAAYIEKHGFDAVESVNTAVAAKEVAEKGDMSIAAIGSAEAADEFGLKILEANINQSNINTTRFAVFSKAQKSASKKDNHFVMFFTVKNAAGSLGRAVSVIGNHGFNLKALKSRPTKELIWDYYFYAEGEGNINGEEGKAMLKELNECCNNIKIVGNFEKEIRI
jgi:chorismate mutase/prephenate dehydratase